MSRIIEVVLSRNMTPFSWMTYFLDGGGLTHASISFEEDSDHYYSFNLKGFKREKKSSLMKYSKEIKRYKIIVTEEQYQALKTMIEEMEAEKSKYAYAGTDVGFCLLKLPQPGPDDEDTYFCSEFVARALDESGCVQMEKEYRAYTPNDIAEALEESGKVREVIQDVKPETGIGGALDSAVDALEDKKDIVVKFVRKKVDQADEAESGISPFLINIGTGTIDACENAFQAVAEKTDELKSTIESIPENLAKKTGEMVDSLSDTVTRFIKR